LKRLSGQRDSEAQVLLERLLFLDKLLFLFSHTTLPKSQTLKAQNEVLQFYTPPLYLFRFRPLQFSNVSLATSRFNTNMKRLGFQKREHLIAVSIWTSILCYSPRTSILDSVQK
jgi:hypothetical protein